MNATLDQRLIRITVNNVVHHVAVSPRQHLVDFLRDELGLKGSHVGCEHGVCGACSLLVNGQLVRGCLMLAVQADGATVQTIEGITQSGAAADLQAAFVARNALQCGYCTPGMLAAALDLVKSRPHATRAEVREWMTGNYCRCTGYQAIVDAVCDVLAKRAAKQSAAGQTGVQS
ncbi:MAG: (2Fe-2S)-binding protein [Burkholderiales bacterium]|nr:(2Fe-2S)-binding protein [Burkholderiales bacterium]